MKQYILNSFTANGYGGNKAAVVFDDVGLSEGAMKAIAKKNNFSETAFIDVMENEEETFLIRYFTPEEEVDICGHAALASFYVLREKGMLYSHKAYHRTKAGRLEVIFQDGVILIEMKKPEMVMEIPEEDILLLTDLEKGSIIPNKKGCIEVISTGLKDIIVEVDSIAALKKLNIKKTEMINYCKEKDLIGMHVVSRETIEADSDFSCRNFAPAVGIDEESATGTSNASMLYYMLQNYQDVKTGRIYKVEQGYFMGSPSNIFIKTENGNQIFVGGRAVIEKEEEI